MVAEAVVCCGLRSRDWRTWLALGVAFQLNVWMQDSEDVLRQYGHRAGERSCALTAPQHLLELNARSPGFCLWLCMHPQFGTTKTVAIGYSGQKVNAER